MGFEWDIAKNKVNITKHGLSFDKAKSVFTDKNKLIMLDVDHSECQRKDILVLAKLPTVK